MGSPRRRVLKGGENTAQQMVVDGLNWLVEILYYKLFNSSVQLA